MSRTRTKHAAQLGRPALLLWVLLLCGCLSGCSRTHYRQQADAQVEDLIHEKASHPHWNIERFSINVDPRSRMFDPFNPDRPPMPHDDPASHEFMKRVYGIKGYQGWGYNGTTDSVQNPEFISNLPLNEEGVLVLSSDEAVQLAILHSPDFQQQLESLYLSALDVSAERFVYDTQFFGGLGGEYANTGRFAPGSGNASRSTATLSTRNVQMRKAYATGAEMVVGLANSLVWQLSGPDTQSASTLLDFTFVQPLLRLAGKDRVLETLTLAERTLLNNVRQMERYRRGFYMDLITGAGGQRGPQRAGGVFGASGLGGFTGVGGGGFGGVGAATFGGGGGGAGAGNAGGYLGLLQTQQNIRNQEANIASLRSSLAQLEAFREANRIDFFQVEQIRQQLFQQTSALLNARRTYQDTLDSFKSNLGLPPQIPVRIEDRLLDRFNLIDPVSLPIQNEVADLQQRVGEVIVSMLPQVGADGEERAEVPQAWSEAQAERLRQLKQYVAATDQLRQQVRSITIRRAREDIERFKRTIPDRKQAAERLRANITHPSSTNVTESEDLDPSLFDTDYLDPLLAQLNQTLVEVELRLDGNAMESAKIAAEIDVLLEQGAELPPQRLIGELRSRVFQTLPDVLSKLSSEMLELTLVQASARAEAVSLVPVEIDAETSLEIARQFRRDWMNARSSLVDAWRRIEFNADNLESSLDIVFDADVRNRGDNPLNLRSSTGSVRAGLQWDAPLTRLQERNLYRQSLIEYQQARRRYYQTEDTVSASLRAVLRQVELNKVNFEIRRTALRVAVEQVRSARYELIKPPELSQTGQIVPLGPTAARNLIDSLDALRNAQDAFLSVWVIFEVQRGLLDLNLGTMELTPDGLWIDPGPIGPDFGYPNKPQPYNPGCVSGVDSYVVDGQPTGPEGAVLVPSAAAPPAAGGANPYGELPPPRPSNPLPGNPPQPAPGPLAPGSGGPPSAQYAPPPYGPAAYGPASYGPPTYGPGPAGPALYGPGQPTAGPPNTATTAPRVAY